MKKLLFIIFLMVFSFAITTNAKKPKVVWPKAVLTLKDGTVLNGYLQNDIHFMKKNNSTCDVRSPDMNRLIGKRANHYAQKLYKRDHRNIPRE